MHWGHVTFYNSSGATSHSVTPPSEVCLILLTSNSFYFVQQLCLNQCRVYTYLMVGYAKSRNYTRLSIANYFFGNQHLQYALNKVLYLKVRLASLVICSRQ